MKIADSAIQIAKNELKAAVKQAQEADKSLVTGEKNWHGLNNYRLGVENTLRTLGLL